MSAVLMELAWAAQLPERPPRNTNRLVLTHIAFLAGDTDVALTSVENVALATGLGPMMVAVSIYELRLAGIVSTDKQYMIKDLYPITIDREKLVQA